MGLAFRGVVLEGVPWIELVSGTDLLIAVLPGVDRGAISKLEARLSPSAKDTDRLSVAGESLARMADCSFFVLSIAGVCLFTEVKESALAAFTLLLGKSGAPKESWVDVTSDCCERSNLAGWLLGGLRVIPKPIPNRGGLGGASFSSRTLACRAGLEKEGARTRFRGGLVWADGDFDMDCRSR